MSNLVSVIMPAYNAEKYIAEAINSVIGQSYTNWELVIVDDGSTDQTAAVISEFLTDQRIHYTRLDHGGQGRARNKAVSQAQGEYIAFLDADDYWLPEKLQKQLTVLDEKGVDLVFSDAYLLEDKLVFEKRINITPGYYQGEEAIRKFLLFNHIPILTVLVKRSVLESFSEDTGIQNVEDYQLWIRMLINGCSFFGMGSTLAFYRRHPESSTIESEKLLRCDINLLQSIKDEWPRYKSDIDTSLQWRIRHYLATSNVTKKENLLYLLNKMNDLGPGKISIPFWKNVYSLFGKNIFRILFKLSIRKKSSVNSHHQHKILLA